MHGFVDLHCHLCAGLDDGPKTEEDVLEMCKIAWDEGIRAIAATAHQNESWPDVTPERIRASVARLRQHLAELDVPLAVYPTAEVMIWPGLEEALDEGQLMSVADGGKYLLIEFPHQLVLDLTDLIRSLVERGIRPILAHPERHGELLHAPGRFDDWVRLGCLGQVSSGSLTGELPPRDTKAVRKWIERGLIHIIGSDGHSPNRRSPRMAGAFRQLVEWIGPEGARRICIDNGQRVLAGEPVATVKPATPPPQRTGWLGRLFGS